MHYLETVIRNKAYTAFPLTSFFLHFEQLQLSVRVVETHQILCA